MSKVFESDDPNEHRTLTVKKSNMGGVLLQVRFLSSGREMQGVRITTTDAPALALAILEAAGVEARTHSYPMEHGETPHLEFIADQLKAYVRRTEQANAEAKEREELEAEALKLFNASRISRGLDEIDWGRVTKSEQREWLAVARKARELAKEAGE